MKTILKYTFILVLSISILSCNNNDDEIIEVSNPIANFTMESVQNTPQLISFTNISENAENYSWDFGDDSEISFEKHPSHYYTSPGNYSVVLKAINQEKESPISQEITIFGNPISDFTYTIDNSIPYTFNFQNMSKNTTSYSWDFGDGIGTSTEENPSFTYASEGVYRVTLLSSGDNGSNSITMDIEVINFQPTYSALYVVGDASPSGWNINSPDSFTQDYSDPFIFTFEGLLTPGELKISTFTGDWCDGDWINPPNNGDDISGSNFIVTNGCDGPDNKWVVTSENQGRYKITVNLQNNTISFVEQLPEYSNLYIVGDASPSGWNIGAPEAFTQSDSDAFEFTYQGVLTSGVLKISTFVGDWCDGNWINSPQDGYELTNTDYIITNNCDGPDNKWTVTSSTQGTYMITINLYHETIMFELQ